ncbi:MAG: hypothetical protein EHM93_17165 [Bacteroidales bacterium]|nr:MAG: hypothetical protein EHM93_17165 [Bacteroidales bacterium]
MTTNNDIYNNLKPYLKIKELQIPLEQVTDIYFPDFLSNALDNYVAYYNKELLQQIDYEIAFNTDDNSIVFSKIVNLSNSIKETIDLFYNGNIFEATDNFNKSLDSIFFNEIQTLSTIKEDTNFYRARKNENKHFTKSDLFHIRFEQRHTVSTNRYSVPGFPALYLGDSTYVCWEEFDRYRLRDLWYSRIVNVRELKVIKIQRTEDFINETDLIVQVYQLPHLLRYLILFPLTIACSIKVKYTNGNFKPEYIIPQLLLQYISKNKTIDGLMFPSTKVDYSKLFDVLAYNYVFPVKSISKKGYCKFLIDTFHVSEPTSLELEEIIYNPSIPNLMISKSPDKKHIELINMVRSQYVTTSFGRIEQSLRRRKVEKI